MSSPEVSPPVPPGAYVGRRRRSGESATFPVVDDPFAIFRTQFVRDSAFSRLPGALQDALLSNGPMSDAGRATTDVMRSAAAVADAFGEVWNQTFAFHTGEQLYKSGLADAIFRCGDAVVSLLGEFKRFGAEPLADVLVQYRISIESWSKVQIQAGASERLSLFSESDAIALPELMADSEFGPSLRRLSGSPALPSVENRDQSAFVASVAEYPLIRHSL